MRRVPLDFSAQRRNVRVARPLVADVGALPEMLHDLAPREDSPRLLGEQGEQVVFRWCERHRLAVGGHFMLDDVDAQAAEPAYGYVALPVELTPAQDRSHAAEELHF